VDIRDITILLVDDEKKFLDTISEKIRLRGLKSLPAQSGEEAIEIAKGVKVDLAIVDHKMPGMDGITTITKLKEIHRQLKTVLLTGHGNEKIKEVAEALDSAYFEKSQMRDFWNFIQKFASHSGMIIINPPYREIDPAAGIRNGLENGQMDLGLEQIEMQAARQTMERRLPSMDTDPSFAFSEPRVQKLIGESPSIQKVKNDIRKISPLDCAVLILGEAGTGKELVARAIHMLSPRRGKKFMAINCASFSEELLRNELFGHEKEAFTGAVLIKKGVFETASGGTILLDEIGDMPLSMQDKLLRVLEEKTVIRVGGTDEILVDVRVLAATNQSLKEKIEKKEFREDLYSRLSAFTLRIPPLRERMEDIPLLCSYFLDKYRKEFDKDIKGVSDEVLSIFMNSYFPGNVRELENVIERSVIVCEEGYIKKEHLPQRFIGVKGYGDTKQKEFLTLAELEKKHIVEVLNATRGNKSEAARILGITRSSLWRKLKEIDMFD